MEFVSPRALPVCGHGQPGTLVQHPGGVPDVAYSVGPDGRMRLGCYPKGLLLVPGLIHLLGATAY
jgi:hypothetical protein